MSKTIAIDARKLRDFGIGTYVRNLLAELGRLDHENRYLVFVRPADVADLGTLPDNFELVPQRSPVYSVRELIALSWRLFRLDVDLYHSTHYVLPAVVPCPAVVTIHDIIHLLFPHFLPNRLAHLYARKMIWRSLNVGDRIIAVSQNTRDDLISYFEIDGVKIEVIYNGVENRFREHFGAEELERRLDELGITRPYLLFVGNPKPHKNLDKVVQAFAKALESGDLEAKLVCVGAREGSDFKVRQRAHQLGIGERVQILGHVSDDALPAIYQGAEVFLYPTLYEGFGLPVIEAMASGTPVITSNTSALREIAGGYAHLVDPLDVGEIARAIAHCLKDEAHRASLRELGLRRAEVFQWARTAQQTHDLYLQVLDRS